MDIDDVETVDHKIQTMGSRFLFAPEVIEQGRQAGVSDALMFYTGGRGGVLGDVAWEQVQSAFAFFPPQVVELFWTQVNEWGSPTAMAARYAAGIAEHGRAVFPEEAATRFVAHAGRVADSIVPMGYPLFVGWRAADRPGDSPAAAALSIMALRELRGDVHVQDIASAGIQPVEAEMVVRGAEGIALHGWQPPYPDAEQHRAAVDAATARTTKRMRTFYGDALDDEDWAEFSAALDELWRVHGEYQQAQR